MSFPFETKWSKLQTPLYPATWTTIIVGRQRVAALPPEAIFLQFRFPSIRFEWEIVNPRFEINRLQSGLSRPRSVILHLTWRAISSASDTGFASLVASGTVADIIAITPDAMPIVERRLFMIENMVLPELIRPRPLPASQPPRTNQTSQRKRSIMTPFSQTGGADIDMKPISSRPLPSFSFPSSAPSARPPDATPADPSPFLDDERRPLKPQEKLIQLLRSSQNVISFVVGFSAMMASTQPLVDPSNHVAGITLAAIGIGSASVSMAGLIIAKVIIMLETTIVKDELTVDMIDKS